MACEDKQSHRAQVARVAKQAFQYLHRASLSKKNKLLANPARLHVTRSKIFSIMPAP